MIWSSQESFSIDDGVHCQICVDKGFTVCHIRQEVAVSWACSEQPEDYMYTVSKHSLESWCGRFVVSVSCLDRGFNVETSKESRQKPQTHSLSSIKYTKPNSLGYEAQTSLTCVCVQIAEYTQVVDSADFWSRQKPPLQVNWTNIRNVKSNLQSSKYLKSTTFWIGKLKKTKQNMWVSASTWRSMKRCTLMRPVSVSLPAA